MSFLCTLRAGVEVARVAVLSTIETRNLFLAGTDTECRQVNRVGTHIGDMSVLVESLCHHHGLRHGESQLAGCFLLHRTGSKRWCRHALHGLLRDAFHHEIGIHALLKECHRLIVRLEAG